MQLQANQLADMQAIVDLSYRGPDAPPRVQPRLRERRGVYHPKTHTISLPVWLFCRPEAYRIAYVVHETIHSWGREYGLHGLLFRRAEIKMLAEWGYAPHDYKRAYYRKLSDLNGAPLWSLK